MLMIRLVMDHMSPEHTQYGQKTARLAPVLQNGLKGHVRPPRVHAAPYASSSSWAQTGLCSSVLATAAL